MKIVIDIPEEIYKASQIIDVKHEDVVQIPLEVIAKSIPLPKGHGRIADLSAVYEDICNDISDMTTIGVIVDGNWLWAKLNDAIDNVPTIIEAESEEEQMTYKELYDKAVLDLEHNKITLGEFEKMIEPLNEEISKEEQTDGDLISRKAVIDGINTYINKAQSTGAIDDFISFEELVVKALPSAEKTAEWEYNSFSDKWRCAKCFQSNNEKTKYCPNCGRRMKGELNGKTEI